MKDNSSGATIEVKLRNYLRKDLIFLQQELTTQIDLFQLVTAVALEHGYVNDKFLPKILAREKSYPTGLQLEHGAVAIPHTDADAITSEFISIVTSKTPIPFQRMDDPSSQVYVKLVFVLGLNQPHAQVQMLKELASMIQNQQLMESIEKASSIDSVTRALG